MSHTTLAAVVALLQAFGLIKGELLSPDDPLAPSYARYQGCPYACEGCHAFRLDKAGRQAWRDPVRSGAQRLPLPCPLPKVVTQVREATAQKGHPTAPAVFLRASEDMADGAAARSDRQQGAPRLGLPAAEGPGGPLSVCHVSRGPQGEVLGNGSQRPADLEAQGGAHVDNHNPSKTASILGYVHRKPPDLHRALHLALPLGKATDPADAHAGAAFLAQRTALALPVLPGQVHLGDAANDVLVPYRWMHDRGGIAVCDDNPRHEPLEPESLLPRGSDQYGTPSAPGGRVCHSNGEDYQAQSRQDVCGRQWSPAEPQRCPHRHGVRGYSHRRTCTAQPRLMGPIQRGPPA